MNDVTKTSGADALAHLRQNLGAVRNRLPEAGGKPFLRMLTDGDWVFGKEDNAIEEGGEVIANPLSIKQGFCCWTDRGNNVKNKNMGDEMFALNEKAPMKSELPVYHDEESGPNPLTWKEQVQIDLKFLGSKYKGQEVLYKTSSVGGLRAMGELIEAVLGRLAGGTSYVCPIIALGCEHYQHPNWGRTYNPVFTVVGWADMHGNEEEEGEAPPQVEEKPARSRKAAPKTEPELELEPAPEPEPETADDPKPVRRRRRASA